LNFADKKGRRVGRVKQVACDKKKIDVVFYGKTQEPLKRLHEIVSAQFFLFAKRGERSVEMNIGSVQQFDHKTRLTG
jgi:sporulation protein YlmC with PRC-barrel domain